MSFVFISHAAPDKLPRVKPLVQALAHEGVALWLDRPGSGDSHFNFDEAFIQRHGIQGLRAGVGWDEGIRQALRDSSAVLVCLSNTAVDPERRVLQQEMTIGWYDDKIVPCIVDDLPFDHIPADLGLPNLLRDQCERVDPAGLQACLDWLGAADGRQPDDLPAALKPAWQIVRKLRDDLAAVAQRPGRRRVLGAPSARAAALHALLASAARPLPLLLRIYRRSLPDPSRALAAPSLAALLRDLEDARPRAAALPSPLVEFAERLARELGDASLHAWLAQHAADEPAAHAELRRQLDGPGKLRTRATLFVDVDPDVLRQIRWWIHAANPRFCSQEQTAPLSGALEAALAHRLGLCLAEAEASIGQDCSITVALLLPKKLVASGLESLTIPFTEDEEPEPVPDALHRRYPVTLHWRKRARARGKPGPREINAWNEALDTLLARTAQGAGASVAWIEADPAGGDGNPFASAADRLRDVADEAFCVGLSPLPPAGTQRLGDDIDACLREGIPCFFWFSRAPAGSADTLRQAVGSEFARHKPCDVPTEVGKLRMKSGAANPFSTLCLVWDEPGHVHFPDLQTIPSTEAAP